jgi:hypothetical protein
MLRINSGEESRLRNLHKLATSFRTALESAINLLI